MSTKDNSPNIPDTANQSEVDNASTGETPQQSEAVVEAKHANKDKASANIDKSSNDSQSDSNAGLESDVELKQTAETSIHSNQEHDSQQQAPSDLIIADENTTKAKSKFLTKLSFLLAVLSLIGAGVVGYFYWQSLNASAQQASLLSSQEARLTNQQARLAQLQTELDTILKQTEQQATFNSTQQQALAGIRQQLVISQDQLRLLTNQGKQEWQIEQAFYYLSLAQQKLKFERNVDVAAALLSQADSTLAAINDLSLTDIRQALAKDFQEVSALPKDQRQALLFKVNALTTPISQLVPIAIKFSEKEIPQQKDNKQWFDELVVTLNNFREDAFKIRTHDEKVQPMLTEQQSSILRTVLQLTISQAQTAILNGNNDYYTNRIEFLTKTIKEYYKFDETSESLLRQLDELAQASFNQPINYQLVSLELISQLKEQRRLQWFSNKVRSTEGKQP
ncbi:MAG: uroporphyrinogen-III C-methyltransferase [Kangiellaceae bacterium]|jgi:uroporphyrin-3 C-methyltransferase|nr:uroporphyrinogen-III C-methyltransferase [Kangiellaceae bacterium]